jgi:hypothetical protein
MLLVPAETISEEGWGERETMNQDSIYRLALAPPFSQPNPSLQGRGKHRA